MRLPKRSGLVAACAAGALAFAGQASAAVMEAFIGGDWNGDYEYRYWSVDIVYDTSRATESPWTDPYGALGHQLIGDGPSAVLSETVTLYGWKVWRGWLGDYDTFTPIPDQVTTDIPASFEIFQSPSVFLIEGYGASGPSFGPGPTLNLGPIPFDQAGYYPIARYSHGGGPNPGIRGAQVYTSGIRLTVLAAGPATTPEPATWAMMLGGFFGLGAMIRKRRTLLEPDANAG